jgi:hypothetical protein
MAHPESPAQNCKNLHPLGLIGSGDALGILPEGPLAAAAAIAVHLHIPTARIPDGFSYLSPTLEDFRLAIRAYLRPIFCFPLDIRKLQDKN